MEELVVVPVYGCILAVWLLILTARVIALRGGIFKKILGFSPNGPEALQRAIRGHGNLTEYAPFFLILLLVAEFNAKPLEQLHIAAVLFLLGRLSHGVAFGFMRHSPILRVAGMILTFSSFISIIRINLS